MASPSAQSGENLLHSGYDCYRSQPERAVGFLRQSIAAFEREGDPPGAMEATYWLIRLLFYTLKSRDEAFDLAMRALVTVSKPAFQNWPRRPDFYAQVTSICLSSDPEAFEDRVRQSCTFLEQLDAAPENQLHVLSIRAALESWLRNADAVYGWAFQGLQLARKEGDLFYVVAFLKDLMRNAAFHDVGRKHMLEWAYIYEKEEKDREETAAIPMVQALAYQFIGNEARSQTAYQRAQTLAHSNAQWITDNYYVALRGWHAARDEWETVAQLYQQQLTDGPLLESPPIRSRLNLLRCEALQKAGTLTETDLEMARQPARQLRPPQRELARINALIAT